MDYIEYQKAPKGGKYTVPPFRFSMAFLHVHKTGKNGQVIYPTFSKSWTSNLSIKSKIMDILLSMIFRKNGQL